MTTQSVEQDGVYAALEGAVTHRLPQAGALRISGETWQDFLQRQTTNDINLLAPERPLLTVLTSPTARIMDVFMVIQLAPDTVLALTVPGRAAQTAAFLKSRIFFNDRVTVDDVSADYAQFDLDGTGAAKLAAELSIPGALLVSREGLVGEGFRLVVPAAQADDAQNQFEAAGAVALDAGTYDVLRVEAGLPGPAELTEDYIPLETNLARSVSDSKGCYTGQEVIARQITYDKITRKLVALRLAGPANAGDAVAVEGKAAGEVTSVAQSPRHGWLALAVIKKPHYESGAQVTVGADTQATVTVPLL